MSSFCFIRGKKQLKMRGYIMQDFLKKSAIKENIETKRFRNDFSLKEQKKNHMRETQPTTPLKNVSTHTRMRSANMVVVGVLITKPKGNTPITAVFEDVPRPSCM